MDLAITGFGIVILIAAWAVGALPLIWLTSKLPKKAQAPVLLSGMLVLVAATSWDTVLISINKAQFCPQAGVQLGPQLVVDGYYDDLGTHSDETLRQSGFRYIEYRDHSSILPREKLKYWRKEIIGGEHHTRRGVGSFADMTVKYTVGGEVHTTQIQRPNSRYVYMIGEDGPVAFGVAKGSNVIKDTQTGTIVSSEVSFSIAAPWPDQMWLRFFDWHRSLCPSTPHQVIEMRTLIPKDFN